MLVLLKKMYSFSLTEPIKVLSDMQKMQSGCFYLN